MSEMRENDTLQVVRRLRKTNTERKTDSDRRERQRGHRYEHMKVKACY